jgi:hypothetical protein
VLAAGLLRTRRAAVLARGLRCLPSVCCAPGWLLCLPDGCCAGRRVASPRRAALLARETLLPVGMLCWPEGCFSPQGCFARWLACGLARWLAGRSRRTQGQRTVASTTRRKCLPPAETQRVAAYVPTPAPVETRRRTRRPASLGGQPAP